MRPDDETLLRAYLLDRLPDAERREIEERYFADDSYMERLAASEAEVIRDYLRGDLSREDRAIVAARYLHTGEGRDRVQFANELLAAAAAFPPAHRSPIRRLRELARSVRAGWGLALAAGLIIALGLGVHLEMETRRLRDELERLRAASQMARTVPAAPAEVSFLLQPDLTRDIETRPKVLLLPQSGESALVRLQCELDPGQRTAHYRAALTVRQGEIWSGLLTRKPDDDFVEVTLPARLLPTGDYLLSLNAAPSGEAHLTYFFRVMSKF